MKSLIDVRRKLVELQELVYEFYGVKLMEDEYGKDS